MATEAFLRIDMEHLATWDMIIFKFDTQHWGPPVKVPDKVDYAVKYCWKSEIHSDIGMNCDIFCLRHYQGSFISMISVIAGLGH